MGCASVCSHPKLLAVAPLRLACAAICGAQRLCVTVDPESLIELGDHALRLPRYLLGSHGAEGCDLSVRDARPFGSELR